MFFSGQIRTMASIFQRLIMGKVRIDNSFFFNGDIRNFIFTEMLIEKSSTFHMAFVQIAEFDWLPGRQKG